MGFFTNLLNPKVTLFFLALFTQVVDQATPALIKIGYGIEMSVMTFVWFAFVATALSIKKIKGLFVNIQHLVERVMGATLIALGLKVVFSKEK